MLLCHYEGIPKSEIAEHFDFARRWINKILKKRQYCHVKEAMRLYQEAKKHYNEKVLQHTLLLNEAIHVDVVPSNEKIECAASGLKDKTVTAHFAAQIKAKNEQIRSLKLQLANLQKQNAHLKHQLNTVQEAPEPRDAGIRDDILSEMVNLRQYHINSSSKSESAFDRNVIVYATFETNFLIVNFDRDYLQKLFKSSPIQNTSRL